MTPEEEAHWRYQLERMTNWSASHNRVISFGTPIPDEVSWLCEEARYYCHLANAKNRRQQTFVSPAMNEIM